MLSPHVAISSECVALCRQPLSHAEALYGDAAGRQSVVVLPPLPQGLAIHIKQYNDTAMDSLQVRMAACYDKI